MPAKTHGDSYSQEYRSWKMMHSRCRNKNDPAYKNYGARGIKVCKRWQAYQPFLEDMGRRPTPQHTLERVKNHIGYRPSNCKWATRAEQLRNKRNTLRVVVNGVTMCAADAARILGVCYPTLVHRARRGAPLTGRST